MTRKRVDQPWVLERRAFLQLGGLGLSSVLMGWPNPAKAAPASRSRITAASVTPRGSARNCLFVFLRGAPSHIDTFDLKVGKWTPNLLGVEKIRNGFSWPSGVMPNLAKQTDLFSIVRSLQHQEVVHERAEYFIETGRRLNPGLRTEIPHMGAVVSLESQDKRAENDVFPSFMMFNYGYGSYSNNGFLPATHAPFRVSNPAYGIHDLIPPDGMAAFDRRRAALQFLDEINTGQADGAGDALSIFQGQAEKLMKDPITTQTFSASNSDFTRYGNNYFGASLVVARNVFLADRGTRFIEVDQYGWDHHVDIYSNGPYQLPALCRQLDQGLSALFEDLAKAPGKTTGNTLLDETLVVVLGEFGRTVGELTKSNGRDHYPYAFSGLLAGGGVKGGRIIGATDDTGGGLSDFGWKNDRPIHLPDLATTIYSALGIDWTKVLTNTPSGRIFRYTDPETIGDDDSYEIDPLF